MGYDQEHPYNLHVLERAYRDAVAEKPLRAKSVTVDGAKLLSLVEGQKRSVGHPDGVGDQLACLNHEMQRRRMLYWETLMEASLDVARMWGLSQVPQWLYSKPDGGYRELLSWAIRANSLGSKVLQAQQSVYRFSYP